jgi:Uma2 family endonuclease
MTVAIDIQHRLFSVRDYYRMAEAGILGEDDRVELIEGEIIEMAPIGPRHASTVDRLTAVLSESAHGKAIVRVQSPLRISEVSEPQPDLMLLQPRDDFYSHNHPTPGDVLLLIEVADSSAGYDRSVKLPLYAGAGVQEVWLIHVGLPEVETYREPSPTGYANRGTAGQDEGLPIPGLAGVRLTVADLLGPA